MRAAVTIGVVLAGHLVYLVVLARALDLADLLPEVTDPEFEHPYTPSDWEWSRAVSQMLPWNLPILAVVIHTAIAAAKHPVLMASAMRKAIEAGREAFLAGRMPRRRYASASSPIEGLVV